MFDSRTVELYRASYHTIRLAKPGMVFVSEASRANFVSRFANKFRFLSHPLYVRSGTDMGDGEAAVKFKVPYL